MDQFGVIAYHLILTNYGFWLPNDSRWSDFVRSWEIFLAGGVATKRDTRRSVASINHDYQKHAAAKNALMRLPVIFNGLQAQAVGTGFANYVIRSKCGILACSVMPRPLHLVVERLRYPFEQAANLLKGAASTYLSRRRLHPFVASPYANGKLPAPWSRRQ